RLQARERGWQHGSQHPPGSARPAVTNSRLLWDVRRRSRGAAGAGHPARARREIVISVRDLPAVNAALNAAAAVLLVCGYILIRRRAIAAHRKVMLAAFVTSTVFLCCYLVYHYSVGSVRFPRTGAIRAVYLSILATHTALAAAVPPL